MGQWTEMKGKRPAAAPAYGAGKGARIAAYAARTHGPALFEASYERALLDGAADPLDPDALMREAAAMLIAEWAATGAPEAAAKRIRKREADRAKAGRPAGAERLAAQAEDKERRKVDAAAARLAEEARRTAMRAAYRRHGEEKRAAAAEAERAAIAEATAAERREMIAAAVAGAEGNVIGLPRLCRGRYYHGRRPG